jgi:YspA, cpYpsA-related SLOG family
VRLLICGDRRWTNRSAIEREIRRFLNAAGGLVIIEGEAKGADSIAREVADELELTVIPFPADWERYGRAAGPVRNTQMLKEGKPDRVLAFHSNISGSKGTINMVAQARDAGIPVEVITE